MIFEIFAFMGLLILFLAAISELSKSPGFGLVGAFLLLILSLWIIVEGISYQDYISDNQGVLLNFPIYASSYAVPISGGQNTYGINATKALDEEYWTIDENTTTTPAFEILVNFTGVSQNISYFDLVFFGEYSGTPDHDVHVSLWNGTSWIFEGRLFENNSNRWYNFTGIPSDAFINNRLVQIRIQHTNAGSANRALNIDYMALIPRASNSTVSALPHYAAISWPYTTILKFEWFLGIVLLLLALFGLGRYALGIKL